MIDTREYIQTLLHVKTLKRTLSPKKAIIKFFFSMLVSLFVAFFPEYAGLSHEGALTLFILVFAALLWISEAIPAFSVSLLIIALAMVLLGFENFDFADGGEWKVFLEPWSSPLVFLFLAGFIMAQAAAKTKLDLWFAKKVLFFSGSSPTRILTGLMAITFVFSMFVSNTATSAMMISVLAPILASMKQDNPFRKAILLGVVIGANIGGMSTIIGTPPNAIAVGILGENAPSFIGWMMLALPPAVLLVVLLRWFLIWRYPSSETTIDVASITSVDHFDDSTTSFSSIPALPSWKKIVVITVFVMTIVLWLSGPLHHIPVTVVSLLPIVAFTVFGIIDSEDIRLIRWDVIILIIGGLSLGLAVRHSGLDMWFGNLIDFNAMAVGVFVAAFCYMVVLISNFMSNTAATNIALPVLVALLTSLETSFVTFAIISVGLCASFAMMLPVSTPPNAIVYSAKVLRAKDFLGIGLLVALVGPILVMAWLGLVY